MVKREQGLQRRAVLPIAGALAALAVDGCLRLGAGAVVVQVGGQEVAVEGAELGGVAAGDVAVTDVLADHGAVFGLHQAVVARLSRPALGLLDAQLFQQLGHRAVDELASVVGVKAEDAKGKLRDHLFEHGEQIGFGDAFGSGRNLPLRNLIDGVDVVNASVSVSRVALVDRVQAQVAGPSLGLGLAALADGGLRGPRLLAG